MDPSASLLVPASGAATPSILLVTIDTWRWDHIGASGQGRAETPNLDRLASEGVYLPKVQTTCPLTTPAHATILTGLLPFHHGIRDNQHFKLKPDVVTLAQRFREASYRTAAVVSGAPLRRGYGLDRGFDSYDDQGLGTQGDSATTPSSRSAKLTTARAVDWLAAQPPGASVFLWVHYYDCHEPYMPPSPFLERFAGHPYAGEVAWVDDRLGPLFERTRSDATRSWIIAVTGDHGEGLGDHGERTHGILLYGPTVDVPLILWTGAAGAATRPGPPGGPAGAGPGPFSLLDVAPTLAALAGLPPWPVDGVSVFSEGASDRWLAAETAYPALGYGLNPGALLRKGHLVRLDQGSEEVYDLQSDPGETSNLADSGQGSAFIREAAAQRGRLLGPESSLLTATLTLPPEQLAALRSLGYVSSGRTGSSWRKVDLRSFAQDFSRMDEARRLFSTNRRAEALAAYDALLAAYPNSTLAWQERGQVLAALGRPEEAARSFGRALTLDPRDAISSLNLGNLAVARGDLQRAESFFKQSLASEEGQPEGQLNLALLYLHMLGRPNDAKPHLRRFLELAPDNPEAPKARELLSGIKE